MKRFLLILLLITAEQQIIKAQFYYKDIIGSKQAASDMNIYKQAKVKMVKFKSFESDGSPTEDFFCERRISKNYKKSTLYSRSAINGKNLMEAIFDNNGNLILTYDSSEIFATINQFFYDDKNRLIKTYSYANSNDDDYNNSIKETHDYFYDNQNQLISMKVIKNNNDTTLILFSADEKFNVNIEKNTKTGAIFYYYYDEANRLTDITHFNETKNKMIADYTFEYNDQNQIIQMISTEEGKNDFFVWKYKYEKNLHIADRIFNKDGDLVGKMEYQYQY